MIDALECKLTTVRKYTSSHHYTPTSTGKSQNTDNVRRGTHSEHQELSFVVGGNVPVSVSKQTSDLYWVSTVSGACFQTLGNQQSSRQTEFLPFKSSHYSGGKILSGSNTVR